MRRKIILVTLLIVGVLLCTGPLWGLLATASGMVGMLERVSGNDEMAAVALFSIAGWIALPLGLATVTGIVLVIARVRREMDRRGDAGSYDSRRCCGGGDGTDPGDLVVHRGGAESRARSTSCG